MAVENISIRLKLMDIKEINKELDAIDKKLASLRNANPTVRVSAEELKKTKSSIDAIDLAIKKLQAQKANLKISNEDAEIAKSKIKEIDHAMNILRAKKAELKISTEQLKGADKQLSNLDKEMQNLRNRKTTLQVDKEDVEKTGSALAKLKSKVQEIGSSRPHINISSNIEELGSKLDSIGSKILNPISSKLTDLVSFSAVFKLIDSGINTVKNSVGGAISRFDTLRQFPKVLGELGVSAEEAAKSKDMLLAGIDGLPTRLNEISSTAQRMYTSFGSMEKATDTANALNNSLLGSGSDAEKAARGTEQYLKVLQSGKMEMDSFNTLSETMDVGLVKIAESFGFAGRTAKKDLYDALGNGTITIDQFNDKMIELGATQDSVMGKLARETTKGIATSTQNLKTAVVNGLEGLMAKFDEASLRLSGKNIAENIASIKPMISKAFEFVGGGIDKAVVFLEQNKDKILAVFKNFDKGAFMEGFKEGFAGAGDSLRTFVDSVRPVIDAAKRLITKFGDGSFEKGLGKLPATLLKIGIASKVAGKGLKVIGKLTNFKLPSLFGGKGGEATSFDMFKGNIFDGITSFTKKAGNLALVFGTIKIIEEAAQAMQDISKKVPNDYGDLAKKVTAMSATIATMGGLAFVASKFNFADSLKGLASIGLISLNIMLAAESIRQLNEKVPGDLAKIGAKVANMSIAIGAMGGLAAIAGVFATSNPVAAIGGLGMILGLSLEIRHVAESLKQLNDKVPDDLSQIATKIGNVAIGIGGFGVLVGAVGALVSTGAGALVGGAGLAAVLALSVEMRHIAESMKQLDDKVPADMSGIKDKIGNIAEAIGYFTAANLGTVLDLFDNAVGALNTGVVAIGLNKMKDLVTVMEGFVTIEVPQGVNKKIAEIEKSIKAMEGSTFKELIGHVVEAADLLIVEKSLDSLKSIGSKLAEIESVEFSKGKVEKVIEKIRDTIEIMSGSDSLFSKIKNLFGNGFDLGSFELANQSLSVFTEIGNKLIGIEKISFDYEVVKKVVGNIKKLIEQIGHGDFLTLLSSLEGLGELSAVSSSIDTFTIIRDKFNKLASQAVKYDETEKVIKDVRGLVVQLNDFPSATALDGIQNLVSQFANLVTTLNGLAGQFEPVGKNYGDQVIVGFKSSKIADGFASEIQKAVNKIKGKTTLEKFKAVGKQYGDELVKGFAQAIVSMSSKIDTQLMDLRTKSKAFSEIGTSFGTLLSNSFDTQIQNLSTTVGKQAKLIQLALDSIKVPNLNPSSSSSKSSNGIIAGMMPLSSGGEVPQYLASGGPTYMMKPKGTDTVPAMLTPGEFVMKKQAVQAYGTDFMNKLNNLNLSAAFRSHINGINLTALASAPVTNIVNNYNTTNDNRINQNVKGNSEVGRELRMNAGRLLRRR